MNRDFTYPSGVNRTIELQDLKNHLGSVQSVNS